MQENSNCFRNVLFKIIFETHPGDDVFETNIKHSKEKFRLDSMTRLSSFNDDGKKCNLGYVDSMVAFVCIIIIHFLVLCM